MPVDDTDVGIVKADPDRDIVPFYMPKRMYKRLQGEGKVRWEQNKATMCDPAVARYVGLLDSKGNRTAPFVPSALILPLVLMVVAIGCLLFGRLYKVSARIDKTLFYGAIVVLGLVAMWMAWKIVWWP